MVTGYKLLGISIENSYIGLVYASMALVTVVFMTFSLLASDSSATAVMIMLVVQLDEQILTICTNWIQL